MSVDYIDLGEVKIAYQIEGDPGAEPVVLICGCGQPAIAWHLEVVPALVSAGYRVVTFDNRGVAPSSSPPAPYSVADLVRDTLGLLDHLEIESARVAGHSMGGWAAAMWPPPGRRRSRRSNAMSPSSSSPCRRSSSPPRPFGTCQTTSCSRTKLSRVGWP